MIRWLVGCFLITLMAGLFVSEAGAFFLTSAAITSIFDITRNSSGNAVFSIVNSKVTAGAGTVTNIQLSAFTNVVHASGKFAFRVTENACTSAGMQGCAIGLGSTSALDNNYLGVSTASVGIFDSGQVFLNGVSVGSGSGFLPGNMIDVEVDLDGKTISWSVNGGAFSTSVSIAGLSGFTLSPGVTMNAATDAFTYNGTVSFPGFPAWNSAPSPPVTGTGACVGVPGVFGLTCNPNFSDNFDGTSLNRSLWHPDFCPGWKTSDSCTGSEYQVAGGLLTLGNAGVALQCETNCIPALPSNWEFRFRFNGTFVHDAIWSQSSLTKSYEQMGNFNGSEAAGTQLEIDLYEQDFDGYATETGMHAWATSGSGPPFQVTEDTNFSCQVSQVYGGGGCGPSQGTVDGGNLNDGQFHTIGVHRFINGSGRQQADFYRDGILYNSITISDNNYTGLINLPQTPIFYHVGGQPNVDIDYFRVWN